MNTSNKYIKNIIDGLEKASVRAKNGIPMRLEDWRAMDEAIMLIKKESEIKETKIDKTN